MGNEVTQLSSTVIDMLLSVFVTLVLILFVSPAARAESNLTWYNAREWGVSGKGWTDTASYYDRFPARAQRSLPVAVWNLSRQSAGMYVEFETDSTTIRARWQLTKSSLALPHMPATGVSGVDLYVMDDSGKWRWLATGQPNIYPLMERELATGLSVAKRRYRLYLPLYNGVQSVEIGVNEDADFTPVTPSQSKPVVAYGTSITQGAVASRPGMAYTAILGRRLDVPFINLGFSGNARMEPEVAMLLAELDPVVYILDAFPNMDDTLIKANFERFVNILRETHPTTPIVIIEDRAYANTPFFPARQAHHDSTRLAVRDVYNRLVDAGDDNLHFVSRDGLFGDDNEGTVDGSHPTDLGFMRMADILEPVLRPLLHP